MKAVHDMLVHRGDLASYDHNDFPGVVPRTFVGAAIIAAVSLPAHAALETLSTDSATRLPSQVRWIDIQSCWVEWIECS